MPKESVFIILAVMMGFLALLFIQMTLQTGAGQWRGRASFKARSPAR